MSFINCPFFDAPDPEPICYDIFVTKYYKFFPDSWGYMSVVVGILVLQAGKRSHKSPQKITKKLSNRLDKSFPCWYNGNNEANKTVGSLQGSKVTICRKSKSVRPSSHRSLALAVRFRKLSRTQTVHSVFVLMLLDSLAGLRSASKVRP